MTEFNHQIIKFVQGGYFYEEKKKKKCIHVCISWFIKRKSEKMGDYKCIYMIVWN